VILAGHARYSAAQLLGCHTVPVIVLSGLSDPEKRALALADNKIAANSGWDRKLLAEELGELATLLPEFDLDLEITGFAIELARKHRPHRILIEDASTGTALAQEAQDDPFWGSDAPRSD
jgi:ParB-like chromosome segregation protein Spo0J